MYIWAQALLWGSRYLDQEAQVVIQTSVVARGLILMFCAPLATSQNWDDHIDVIYGAEGAWQNERIKKVLVVLKTKDKKEDEEFQGCS
jgi:hypothetical protein